MDDGARAAPARHVIGRTLGALIVVIAVLGCVYAYRLTFVQPRTDDAAVHGHWSAQRGADPLVTLFVKV